MYIKNHPRVAAWGIRGGLFVFSLAVIAPCLAAQDQFDKDAFLSRKKWYLSFTLRLKGAGDFNKPDKKGSGYDKLEWKIHREVSGVIELGTVVPGQFPFSHVPTNPSAFSEKGRFIGWRNTSPKNFTIDVAAIKRGESRMQGNSMFLPVSYIVNDRVDSESVTHEAVNAAFKLSGLTKIQGGGTAYMTHGSLFTCDLKEMMFDLNLDGARTTVGFKGDVPSVKTHRETHSREEAGGVNEDREFPLKTDKPDNFLPTMTETLAQQLLWRKLEIHEGRIAFTVSEPVTKLPWGFDRNKNGGPPLELSLEIVISPTPPSQAKLILKPLNYETWRPLCSDAEDTKGNNLQVEWRVEEEGGDPAKPAKVRRVAFSLLNTSKEPGVCMNYPLQPKTPADFDLKFEATTAPHSGYGVGSDGQKLTLTQDRVGARKGTVAIDCFDSGATGVLVAEAELEDGRVLTATIEGPGGNQLMIPDFDPGVSWIAKDWRSKHAPGKKDDADDEDFPKGDGQRGDGLTVWEEYRGFRVGGRWDGNCDPKTKDLFIDNPLAGVAQGGIWLFASITELRIHDLLAKDEHRVDRVINFNKGGRPHLVDQHCLVIAEGGVEDSNEGAAVSAASITKAMERADFPGPPKNTKEVSYLPAMLVPPRQETDAEGKIRRFARVDWAICHELGHGLGLRHHGDKDSGFSDWTFHRNANGEPVNTINGKEVIVKHEKTGKFMVPSDYMPEHTEGKPWRIWIGERHGQMSGDDNCIMRYVLASMYRSEADSNLLFFFENDEKVGNRLCTSPAGTGVNMPTHEPQSRYGGADTGRGDCAHKFVVSDHWDKIHR